MWTQFWDMHSGGRQKEKWSKIYIEAPEEVAQVIFFNRFGHSPERVTCACCGEDYSISEYETLEQASAYHRGCEYEADGNTVKESGPRHRTVEQYIAEGDALVIRASEIDDEERVGEVPVQGYVYV